VADVQVSIKDGTGYLLGVPGPVMDRIRTETRFRPVGFQFSPKFQRFVGRGDQRRRIWDGYVHLVRHSKFPGGLLERVVKVLRDNHIEPKIIVDHPREFPTIEMGLTGLESREYQDRAVESALMSRRGVVRAPTGAGKTAIEARVIKGHSRRAVVIVPTIDLLYQTKRFLEKHLIVDGGIGQLGDGVVDPRDVTVSTVRTMAKVMSVSYSSYEYAEYDDKDDTKVNPLELRRWVDNIGTLIVDEAHILGAQVVYDIATSLSAPNKYGFSASPWRDDGADLMIEGATGPLLYRIGTKELVDAGWLVPPIIQVVNTRGLWVPGAWKPREFQKAYKREIVENPVRNALVARHVNELNMPTLTLVKQVNHGRILQGLIEGSHFLSGGASSDERTAAYEAMRNGELRVIIATTIADMGLDLPICRALVLAGGGKSSTRHLQRIGRVARPYPGKDSALVIDFDDTHVHRWFRGHAKARRRIEHAEWADSAIWI
jgi:superfamily II DNA or RNA helicase